jgi:ABC-2 type transport system ATP-binding protein
MLVREGYLQELIAIEDQTELVIAGASEELMREIESVVSRPKAKLLERRKSTTTLERLFLESTGANDKTTTRE